MNSFHSEPKFILAEPSYMYRGFNGRQIDLNNLNSTELNSHIIKCLSRRIDFLENRVDNLEKNQEKILKLLIDTINAIDKKEVNRRNLYPDRINSSVRKK